MNIENYIREGFKKEGGKLTTTGTMGQYIFCFRFCVYAHFSKFSMYAWGKMLVFTGVYVSVEEKVTLVRFFPFFFAPFPYHDCPILALPSLGHQYVKSTLPYLEN